MPLSRFAALMGALDDPAVAERTCGHSLLDRTVSLVPAIISRVAERRSEVRRVVRSALVEVSEVCKMRFRFLVAHLLPCYNRPQEGA